MENFLDCGKIIDCGKLTSLTAEKIIGLVILKANASVEIKSRTFNISIDSSSLNIFSSSFLHLLQIIERTNVFFQDV